MRDAKQNLSTNYNSSVQLQHNSSIGGKRIKSTFSVREENICSACKFFTQYNERDGWEGGAPLAKSSQQRSCFSPKIAKIDGIGAVKRS